MNEILKWAASRCRMRASEVACESDLNGLGIECVLRWLDADQYTFEQKFTTLASVDAGGGVGDSREFLVVGEQLRRLRFRCRDILTLGTDPGATNPFTFVVPSPFHNEDVNFRERFVQNAAGEDQPALRNRFKTASDAILQVARWIDERGFDVI